MGWVTESIN